MNPKVDKELVRQRFSKRLAAYDSLAVVQQRIAAELAGYFSVYAPARFESVLEVGCGTGFLTRELLKIGDIGQLYLNDIVPEALPVLQSRLVGEGCTARIGLIPGDAEHTAVPSEMDLVASASAMQWFEDLGAFFAKAAAALKPDGWFVFNLFGPRNLHQIKALTGIGLEYLPADALRDVLGHCFRIEELREQTVRQGFDTPFDALRHLQQTGVTASGDFRWTPGKLRAFERDYMDRYGEGGTVFLDWDVLYVIARKCKK